MPANSPGYGRIRVVSESRRRPLVPNGVMGMLIFVICEAMLFAGLISAFTILRASAPVWPPPGQPRLPVASTAVNTAMLLGGGFVAFQGVEWFRLIREGLTLTSSTLGSFFYLIVGMHALHALAALALLVYTWVRLQRGWLAQSQLATAAVFWYFVVIVWPILYAVVYL